MEIARKRAQCGRSLPDGKGCRRWATRILFVPGFGDIAACQRCTELMTDAVIRQQFPQIEEVIIDDFRTITYYEAGKLGQLA